MGPAGVTLQFAIALRARGSWATVRELDNRPPPSGPAAPWCALGEWESFAERSFMLTVRCGYEQTVASAAVGAPHVPAPRLPLARVGFYVACLPRGSVRRPCPCPGIAPAASFIAQVAYLWIMHR